MKRKYYFVILFLVLAIFLSGCGGVVTPAIPTPVVEIVKPLDDYTNNISQRFGDYLGYYGGKHYDGFHSGEDISVVAGTPVYAITSGRVATEISDLGALGHLIVLEHNKGHFKIPGRNEEIDGQSYHYPSEEVDMIYSVYIHVDPGALSKNDWVETGEKIADIADISAAGLGATFILKSVIQTRNLAVTGLWWETLPTGASLPMELIMVIIKICKKWLIRGCAILLTFLGWHLLQYQRHHHS